MSGKRSKKAEARNRFTGAQRRWTFKWPGLWTDSPAWVDDFLELAEVFTTTPPKTGFKGMPRPILEAAFKDLYAKCNALARALGIPSGQVVPDARFALAPLEVRWAVLTEAEYAYCRNEGIDIGQFACRRGEAELRRMLEQIRQAS